MSSSMLRSAEIYFHELHAFLLRNEARTHPEVAAGAWAECFWLLLQYTTLYSSKPGIQRLSISKHCAFLKRLARKNSLAWKREAFEIEAQYQSFR